VAKFILDNVNNGFAPSQTAQQWGVPGATLMKKLSGLSCCVFYIMGRAIVIAVILQSDPSIKMYMGLRAGKQLNQEHTHIQ
jgi:hypothetical protein